MFLRVSLIWSRGRKVTAKQVFLKNNFLLKNEDQKTYRTPRSYLIMLTGLYIGTSRVTLKSSKQRQSLGNPYISINNPKYLQCPNYPKRKKEREGRKTSKKNRLKLYDSPEAAASVEVCFQYHSTCECPAGIVVCRDPHTYPHTGAVPFLLIMLFLTS